jgi:hypothetical protein
MRARKKEKNIVTSETLGRDRDEKGERERWSGKVKKSQRED